MKKLKESKTVVIKRSQINLNPFNPKNHSDEKVKFQKRNLQEIGFLGGITWNCQSGNLIDGHRRIMAMDLYYRYDGTSLTNYDVKVESVELDNKQEKEQMVYMALGNTQADYNLVAKFIGDIDYKNAGISDVEFMKMAQIADIAIGNASLGIETFDDMITLPESRIPETREQIRDKKEHQKQIAIERQEDEQSSLTLSFSTFENKVAFCEIIGVDPYQTKFIKGEDLFDRLDEA